MMSARLPKYEGILMNGAEPIADQGQPPVRRSGSIRLERRQAGAHTIRVGAVMGGDATASPALLYHRVSSRSRI
jgi:hypothetical protein